MDVSLVKDLFLVLSAALFGGLIVKILKLQPIIGYILSGFVFGIFFPSLTGGVLKLAEFGAILLLFSIGLELTLSRLEKIFKAAVIGGFLQIVFSTLFIFFILLALGLGNLTSFILAMGFSLSSTAVVVKILSARGNTDTVYGELMIGWLLVQDLAVIPMMIILPTLTDSNSWLLSSLMALGKALFVILFIVILGRFLAPKLLHFVASLNSRELLIITAVALALGTAILTSYFGISAALGAFLAGVVISETQENHAVFAETRPLRDLFVALFFVSLGYLLKPEILISKIGLILLLVVLVLFVKFVIFMVISYLFGYYRRTAFMASLGLTEVGEFSFIILSQAVILGLVTTETASVGMAVALITLLLTPILMGRSSDIWGLVKNWRMFKAGCLKAKMGADRLEGKDVDIRDHTIICGFGRVGSWVGKAFDILNMPYIVVDYNQKAIKEAKKKGLQCVYGDASEIGVLEKSRIDTAKAVIIAIPDRFVQEEIITRLQTKYPNVKIYSRARYDEDWERLKFLRVKNIVQPEFEASLFIVRSILKSMGKSSEEMGKMIKTLRQSRSMSI